MGRHQRSPRKIWLAAAYFKPLVGGHHHFPDGATVAKSGPKHSETRTLTPCKDQHSRIDSWVGMFLVLLLKFPFLVHFMGVHNCHTAQCLIAHIETLMHQMLRHAAACFKTPTNSS